MSGCSSKFVFGAAMSHNSSPNNVPSAKNGDADSLAAPGLVGAGGTISRLKARWKREWAEVGPFIGSALLGLLLNVLEVLIFVGIPITVIAVVVVFAMHFFRVAA